MERSKYDFSAVTLLVAIAAVSLTAGQGTAQSPGHDMADGLKLNVVKIEAVSADHTEIGFGFIVGERSGALYVATAYHVVAPPEGGDLAAPKVKVQFYDHQGTGFDATVVTHDGPHDLAVLTVVPPQGFTWKKHCLGRTNEHQKLGTEVWNVGRSGNWSVPVSPGHIATEEIIDGVINVETLSILPGSSGGPLVAPSGIVGLILRDSAENTTALSITYVKSLFKTPWNHPWDLELAETAAPPPVVAQVPPTAPPPATSDPAASQPTQKAQSRTSSTASTAGTQLLGALVGGLLSAQTSRGPTDRCQQGYVWREARQGDHVCVAPEVRQRTADENATAGFHRDPSGAYGPDTCLNGYVWREAVQGDHVCVVPRSRDQAAYDNRNASSRVAH